MLFNLCDEEPSCDQNNTKSVFPLIKKNQLDLQENEMTHQTFQIQDYLNNRFECNST